MLFGVRYERLVPKAVALIAVAHCVWYLASPSVALTSRSSSRVVSLSTTTECGLLRCRSCSTYSRPLKPHRSREAYPPHCSTFNAVDILSRCTASTALLRMSQGVAVALIPAVICAAAWGRHTPLALYATGMAVIAIGVGVLQGVRMCGESASEHFVAQPLFFPACCVPVAALLVVLVVVLRSQRTLHTAKRHHTLEEEEAVEMEASEGEANHSQSSGGVKESERGGRVPLWLKVLCLAVGVAVLAIGCVLVAMRRDGGDEGCADHMQCGVTALHLFEYDEALRHFRAAHEADPCSTWARWGVLASSCLRLTVIDMEGQVEVPVNMAVPRHGQCPTPGDEEARLLAAAEEACGKRREGALAHTYRKRLRGAKGIEGRAHYSLALLVEANGRGDLATAIALRSEARRELLRLAEEAPHHAGVVHYTAHAYSTDPQLAAHARLAVRTIQERYRKCEAMHIASRILWMVGEREEAVNTSLAAATAGPEGCLDRSTAWSHYMLLHLARAREAALLVASQDLGVSASGAVLCHRLLHHPLVLLNLAMPGAGLTGRDMASLSRVDHFLSRVPDGDVGGCLRLARAIWWGNAGNVSTAHLERAFRAGSADAALAECSQAVSPVGHVVPAFPAAPDPDLLCAALMLRFAAAEPPAAQHALSLLQSAEEKHHSEPIVSILHGRGFLLRDARAYRGLADLHYSEGVIPLRSGDLDVRRALRLAVPWQPPPRTVWGRLRFAHYT